MNVNDSIQREPTEEEKFNQVAEIIFSNVKLYLETSLQRLEPLFQELYDIKCNLATITSVLHSKKIFEQEEYRDCYMDIRKSFGEVKSDGEMEGEIELIKYNFPNN